MAKSGGRKRRPQGCSLRSHRLRRLKPLTPTLSPATHSAMPSMLPCCTSDLKRRRRKNRTDFGNLRYALTEMSRLLSLTTADQEHAVVDLLKIVCTEKWLAGVYKFGLTFGLAGALHSIAVHQPPPIICRFWHPVITARARKELSGWVALDDGALNAAIEFIGAISLAGQMINRTLLINAPLDRIGRLPSVLPHRSESIIVEQWQRQLWLGLRVVASVSAGQLIVDPEVIDQTLNLWHKNIDGAGEWPGTKEQPDSTAHRINVSMVKWLENCARSGTGRLLPSQEPLWVLGGFPRYLKDATRKV